MKYFKINNLTNTLKKRDVRFNTVLDISYIDGMIKKIKKVYPDQVLFLELPSLPLSLHKMRINGLVTVTEINKNEFLFEQNKEKQKKIVPKEIKVSEKKETKPTKKYYKKKAVEDDDLKIDLID
jgi:hypothetical protein